MHSRCFALVPVVLLTRALASSTDPLGWSSRPIPAKSVCGGISQARRLLERETFGGNAPDLPVLSFL